jgi:hypothetical protein
MVFLLLGPIGLVVGGVAYAVKPRCSQCESKFTWNEACVVCAKPVCHDCGTDFAGVKYEGVNLQAPQRCCKVHVAKMEELLAAAKGQVDKDNEVKAARERASAQTSNVVLYSKNYAGRKEPLRLNKRIETARPQPG